MQVRCIATLLAMYRTRRPPLGQDGGRKPPCGPPRSSHLDAAARRAASRAMSVRELTPSFRKM